MDRSPVRAEGLSIPVALLGGTVGTILLTAIGRAAPLAGLPALRPDLAVGGYWVFFLLHAVAVPLGLAFASRLVESGRPLLPALGRALLLGAGLWVAWGVVVSVAFGPDLRLLAVLLLGEIAFAAALAAIAVLPRGISPVDSLGWMWTSHAGGESP